MVTFECYPCNGKGQKACRECLGRGWCYEDGLLSIFKSLIGKGVKVTCGTCNGACQFQCAVCQGSGKQEATEKLLRCPGCLGKGANDCSECRGSGLKVENEGGVPWGKAVVVTCPKCVRKRCFPCARCGGRGAL